ncbi:hypothetical protein WL15_27460 [Burkholderia multivorans]|nr:hypothetical protein WL15_27460 [Burkholderia multivorans]
MREAAAKGAQRDDSAIRAAHDGQAVVRFIAACAAAMSVRTHSVAARERRLTNRLTKRTTCRKERRYGSSDATSSVSTATNARADTAL